MNVPLFNPWAPVSLNGFNPAAPEGCNDVDHAYCWPEKGGFQTLAGNEERLNEVIALEQDSDFVFSGFIWALSGENQVGFLYRIVDDQGNYVSDGYMHCFATPGTFANPFPWFPHVTYSRHQNLRFDILNPSDSPQDVQLVFRGPNRYRRIG